MTKAELLLTKFTLFERNSINLGKTPRPAEAGIPASAPCEKSAMIATIGPASGDRRTLPRLAGGAKAPCAN